MNFFANGKGENGLEAWKIGRMEGAWIGMGGGRGGVTSENGYRGFHLGFDDGRVCAMKCWVSLEF